MVCSSSTCGTGVSTISDTALAEPKAPVAASELSGWLAHRRPLSVTFDRVVCSSVVAFVANDEVRVLACSWHCSSPAVGPLFSPAVGLVSCLVDHPALSLLTSRKYSSALFWSCLSITLCVTLSWRTMKCLVANCSLVYCTLLTHFAWFAGLSRSTPPIRTGSSLASPLLLRSALAEGSSPSSGFTRAWVQPCFTWFASASRRTSRQS